MKTKLALSMALLLSVGNSYSEESCWTCLGPVWSDINLKTKIRHLNVGSEWLDNIIPSTFTWEDSRQDSIGFIAQDLERVDTRLVIQGEEGAPCTVEDKRGCKRIDLAGIIAILTAEVKTLRAEVNALKSDQRVGY